MRPFLPSKTLHGIQKRTFLSPKSVKALYSSLSKLEIEFVDFDTHSEDRLAGLRGCLHKTSDS